MYAENAGTVDLIASEQSATVIAPGRYRVAHHRSVADISRDDWNALFTGHAENWDYFTAVERSRSEHFTYSAIAVYSGDRLIAAAPLFRLDYRLDMTLPESLRPIADTIARWAPRLLKMPVLGMGSPMTEECPIGIDGTLDDAGRQLAVKLLIDAMHAEAKAQGIKVLALKDVTDGDMKRYDATIQASGFARMASLPVATLPLPFDTIEGYLNTMTSRQRSDMRRKFKSAKGMDFEWRDDISDVHDEILALYRATRNNRKASYEAFDEVPEDYFRQVMAQSGGKARVLLCRIDGVLASFNLSLVEKDKVIGKFIGMDYSLARQNNLYFVNWMKMIEFCIENGIGELQTGQTTYAVKARMGCKLRRSWIYFKHSGLVLGALFRMIGPRISFEAADPELAGLGDKAVYLEQTEG
ncbi:MAG: GNAT family N-acetyltransferase [Hyphomicrobiaceae bacterium]|nr:GNAT family N-acetyltransferase [Hyphomicrobiaceae bacterium]